ncbi:MAG: hypothetical protein D5R96_06845 [Methanocalculus sp. MSAO_Arc2]|uniref:hypothetical protein n=1 Tax=Methanocalculus sp. MSAO_Arc2 TaxID=2293855 RepID=UPI000FEE2D7C|nr:MAG: hypothetical protein D5R96_06845 [Methanocalculus sp. MSAO_Arc2]
MGTFTGQILIGKGHPNHDGIILDAQLFISENSRPVLILNDIQYRSDINGRIGNVRWIPTLENPIDDALLMISTYYLARLESRVPELDTLIEQVESGVGPYKHRNTILPELYHIFTQEQRTVLYEMNQKIISTHFNDLKLVLTILDGCLLMRQLPRLKEYGINLEVCLTVYSHLTSGWRTGFDEKGDLERCIKWKRGLG